jgi:hypothetical protein
MEHLRYSLSRAILLLGPIVAGNSAPTMAQWAVDGRLASNDVWRGRTLRDAWVAEVDAMVDVLPTKAFITLGLSAVAELSRPSPTSVHMGHWLGRWTGWVEVAAANREMEGAAGLVYYGYPEGENAQVMPQTTSPAPDRFYNTVELYARAEARFGWVTTRGAFFVDLDEIRGTYYELGSTVTIPVLPEFVQAIHVEAEAALSGGQSVGTALAPKRGYFFSDGLTHVGFALTPQLSFTSSLTKFFVTPSLHVQWSHDDATRRRSLNSLAAVKAWFSVTASVHR